MSAKVKWICQFPDHWDVLPSKRLFPESKERALESDEQLSASQDYGVISQAEFMRLAGRRVVQLNRNIDLRKRVEIGDFVISMRSFQGGLERAWTAGGIRSSYVVLRPRADLELGYYQYLFKSTDYIQALQSTATFIRDGQDMNYQNFVLIDLPSPPRSEQYVIARFLDHETARIDALIEEQQRLIELLKEKRQAEIAYAVTKGLNPTVRMKDSGVEWQGEVPAHWAVGALGYFAAIDTGATPDRANPDFWGGDIPWIKTGEVNYEPIVKAEEYITVDGLNNSAARVAPKGTLLMAMYGQGITRGRVAILDIDAAYNQACAGIFVDKRIDVRFLRLFFIAAYQYVRGGGNESSQMNLSSGYIAKIKIPVPPIDEQIAVTKFLENEILRFDSLIGEAESLDKYLRERRSALISAAVTGTIDVRGWHSPVSAQSHELEQEAV